MLRCIPFLLFDGNCAEAMTFYQKCLGGDLTLAKLGDTPMKDQFPAEKHVSVCSLSLSLCIDLFCFSIEVAFLLFGAQPKKIN